MHLRLRRRKPRWRRYLRLAASTHRNAKSDLGLAVFLAMIAGSANAGGFMLLGSYSSHMTGYISQIGDQLALFNLGLALKSATAILSFVLGAASSSVMINWAKLHHSMHRYTIPIGVQGLLLLVFSSLGLDEDLPAASKLLGLFLLAFIMGLQNATITKISGARIRTSHATGMVTDVGIEIGKAVLGRALHKSGIAADKAKLKILLSILGSFFVGGVIGAFGFAYWSYFFALPMGIGLIFLAVFRS